MSEKDEITRALSALKPRERAFVMELRKHGRQGDAARAAGYPDKSADVTASRLVHREDIQNVLSKMYESDCKALCISSDSVILRAHEIYNRCMQAEPVMRYDTEQGRWVESGTYQFDSRGAAKALDVIVKVAGLDKKTVELDGEAFTVNVKVTE